MRDVTEGLSQGGGHKDLLRRNSQVGTKERKETLVLEAKEGKTPIGMLLVKYCSEIKFKAKRAEKTVMITPGKLQRPVLRQSLQRTHHSDLEAACRELTSVLTLSGATG